MARGQQVEALIRRLDRTLTTLERKSLSRLRQALLVSERRLEGELRRLYLMALEDTLTSGQVMREARARILLQQVRASLDIAQGAGSETVMLELVRDAYAAGVENATAALSLYQAQAVSLSATVRVEVVARATNAAARLSHHGQAFAEKAERHIIDGIVRGQGWSRTARELRRETGVTLRQAETIVRTESITASDDARRDAYQEAGVEYVQRFATMDDRVCGWCAERAGKVYKASEAPAALHPNCRCYNAPWKKEWQELGLTDDEWAQAHRRETIDRARAAGEKIHTGPSPFEKAAGIDPPEAVWSP